MSSPAFPQPERRSYLFPILLALAAVVAALALARSYFPSTSVDTAHIQTRLLPTTTVLKSDSIVIGARETDHTLFVASTIRIDNHRRHPIFLDGFKLTFTNPDGAQLTVKGATRSDLAAEESNFPALVPLAANPLQVDVPIDPGKSAQGTIVFALPIPQQMWEHRKLASITIDVYHENPVYQDIPSDTPAKP